MQKIGDALSSLALEQERVEQFTIGIDEYDKLPAELKNKLEKLEETIPEHQYPHVLLRRKK